MRTCLKSRQPSTTVHREHHSLRKKGGKKVFELHVDVPWHKGHAVLWLRQNLGLDRPDVMSLYIGDDETDEDAFAVLGEPRANVPPEEEPETVEAAAAVGVFLWIFLVVAGTILLLRLLFAMA